MYYFIINPMSCSGKGIKVWHQVNEELIRRQIAYRYFMTKHTDHAKEIAKEICESETGIKVIVVLGGDGTVNEVINGLQDFENVVLGYIPSGSSNDLGRSLKLGKDPIENLNKILTPARYQFMDMGFVQGEPNKYEGKFIVSSGVGFDAAICEETFRSTLKSFLNKLHLGKLIYLLIAIKQLLFCSFMEGEVAFDKGPIKKYEKILMVTSMNQKYEGGGLKIAPTADPRDGKLSVCLIHGISRIKLLFLLPTLLFGKHTLFKGVETFNCHELEIKLVKSGALHVDGECPGSYTHIRYYCKSKILKVVT